MRGLESTPSARMSPASCPGSGGPRGPRGAGPPGTHMGSKVLLSQDFSASKFSMIIFTTIQSGPCPASPAAPAVAAGGSRGAAPPAPASGPGSPAGRLAQPPLPRSRSAGPRRRPRAAKGAGRDRPGDSVRPRPLRPAPRPRERATGGEERSDWQTPPDTRATAAPKRAKRLLPTPTPPATAGAGKMAAPSARENKKPREKRRRAGMAN